MPPIPASGILGKLNEALMEKALVSSITLRLWVARGQLSWLDLECCVRFSAPIEKQQEW